MNSDKFIVPENHYFFLVIIETVQKIADFFQVLAMFMKTI